MTARVSLHANGFDDYIAEDRPTLTITPGTARGEVHLQFHDPMKRLNHSRNLDIMLGFFDADELIQKIKEITP